LEPVYSQERISMRNNLSSDYGFTQEFVIEEAA